MKIGDTVKIVNDSYYDYGYYLNRTGTIFAGGCKYKGIVRWLIDFGNGTYLHCFEPDLKLL